MKSFLFCSILLTVFIFYSCKKEEQQIPINIEDNLSFSGTFETIDSENISGTVFLNISNGYYECVTSLPYGHGAGKLEANETTINFIDTLFFAVPAIYGPSYVLSSENYYEFDGENLKIWKEKNMGSIEYNLKILNSENTNGILMIP